MCRHAQLDMPRGQPFVTEDAGAMGPIFIKPQALFKCASRVARSYLVSRGAAPSKAPRQAV